MVLTKPYKSMPYKSIHCMYSLGTYIDVLSPAPMLCPARNVFFSIQRYPSLKLLVKLPLAR
jgi:hypothetical protein